MLNTRPHPVIIIGAGPVGLAAAAHLLARGIPPLILERGERIAENIRDWGHVRLFSPWRYNMDRAARELLAAEGWVEPAADLLPTGQELVEQYLQPLARVPAIATRLLLGHEVVAVSRSKMDKVKSSGRDASPFVIRAVTSAGAEVEFIANAILDASGTWRSPNPVGANGLRALGEHQNAERIHYGIPDVLGSARRRYAGRSVMVVGSGHSAANTLLDLAKLATEEPQTRLIWAVRGNNLKRAFGGGAGDMLPARGALGSSLRNLEATGALQLATDFGVSTIRFLNGAMTIDSQNGQRIEGVDEIIAATGQRPDLATLRELRLALDPWLECTEALGPLIDPNLHSCGTVRPHGAKELAHPEPGFFTVGVKSYGRAPTFLLATGYEQVRSIAALLAGDLKAAAEVELDLPETGVCSSNLDNEADAEQVGCCGGPAPIGIDACCVKDADAKAAGEDGCGCGTAEPAPTAKAPSSSGCCDQPPSHSTATITAGGPNSAKELTGVSDTAPSNLIEVQTLATAQSGCCGGPAPENTDACCVKDADAKAAGEEGCGCGSVAPKPERESSVSSAVACCAA